MQKVTVTGDYAFFQQSIKFLSMHNNGELSAGEGTVYLNDLKIDAYYPEYVFFA